MPELTAAGPAAAGAVPHPAGLLRLVLSGGLVVLALDALAILALAILAPHRGREFFSALAALALLAGVALLLL